MLGFFPLRYVVLLPILIYIGYSLRARLRMKTAYIAVVLFAIASCVSIAIRWVLSDLSGWRFWFDAVFMYGIVNSLNLTVSALGSYTSVRDIGFRSRRMEVQIVKRPFIRLFLSFITASVLFGIIALIFGASFSGIFFKITDGWIFGFLFMAAFVTFTKIALNKDEITPLFIVTICASVLFACMFSMASMADDVNTCIIGIVLSGISLAVAGICTLVPYMKARKKAISELKDFDPESYRKAWAVVRGKLMKMDEEKQKRLLEGFLVFKLDGNSIYGDVDMSAPLFTLTAEDGSQKLVPVDGAKEAGAADADIEAAKAYIAGLIG